MHHARSGRGGPGRRNAAVMYAGRVVESAAVVELYRRPAHPYTVGLFESRPRAGGEGALRPIPGVVPSLATCPGAARFRTAASGATTAAGRTRPGARSPPAITPAAGSRWRAGDELGPAVRRKRRQALPAQGGRVLVPQGPGAGGAGRVAGRRGGRGLRPGGRERLRQVHPRPGAAAPRGAHGRPRRLRRRGRLGLRPGAAQAVPARGPDHLPGPLRGFEPAPPHR